MTNIKSSKGKIISTAITILIIAMMLLPILISTGFSVFSKDDFSIGYCVKNMPSGRMGYLSKSLNYVKVEYMGWQGAYTADFLEAIFHPLNGYGHLQLSIEMVLSFLIWSVTLLFVIISILKSIEENSPKVYYAKCLACIAIIYILFEFTSYTEIYYWFTSNMEYLIPLVCLIVGLICAVDYSKMGKNYWLIGAILAGIISMGGMLPIAGMGCYSMLLVLIYNIFKNKRISFEIVFVEMIWIICALISALSPGNFLRKDSDSDLLQEIPRAIYNSLRAVWHRIEAYCSIRLFVIALILIICGYIIGASIDKNIILYIVSLLGLMTPFVAVFPVALGYGCAEMPNRVVFVIDFCLWSSASVVLVLFGSYLGNILEYKKFAIKPIIIICLAILTITFYKTVSFNVIKELCNGEYSRYYSEYIKVIDYIQNEEGEDDIYISYSDMPNDIENIYPFYLDSNPDDWVNHHTARWYGHHTIIMLDQ